MENKIVHGLALVKLKDLLDANGAEIKLYNFVGMENVPTEFDYAKAYRFIHTDPDLIELTKNERFVLIPAPKELVDKIAAEAESDTTGEIITKIDES